MVLKNGDFFSALPGLRASAPSGRVCGTNIRKRNMTTESWERMRQTWERKNVSVHSRQETWGTSVIDRISEQLRRELLGLRGFSSQNIRNMRSFYEY